MNNSKSTIAKMGIIFVIIAVLVFSGIALTRNIGKSDKVVDKEGAVP